MAGPHHASPMQPPLAYGVMKDDFQDCRSSYGNASTVLHLRICNSACRWRKFWDVLDCSQHRLEVSTCQKRRRRWDSAGLPSMGLQCGTVGHDSSLSLNMLQQRLKTHLSGQSWTPSAPLWHFSMILAPDIDVLTDLPNTYMSIAHFTAQFTCKTVAKSSDYIHQTE